MLAQVTPSLLASYRAKEAELLSIIQSLEVSLELHKQENEQLRRQVDEHRKLKEFDVSKKDELLAEQKDPSNKQLMNELSKIRTMVERSVSPVREVSSPRAPLSPIVPPLNVSSALESFDLASKINTSRTTSRIGSNRFGELRTLYKVNQHRQPIPAARVEQVIKQVTRPGDELKAIDKLMQQGGYLKMFEKVGPGTYMFGSKRVLITVKNNRILVRNGGAFVEIEDFLSPYMQ